MNIRRQSVIRYITPLREGGSLPALAEADDGFDYVLKFRGAGHGKKALIAEFIGGEVARRLGFNVPELVFLDVDERFGITEPDEEIQDLLRSSRGLNIGMHFLSGALTLDPYINPVDALTASRIVWLDAFLTNVDRTAMNTNMLLWHGNEIWLIDHGASLYFHHSWRNTDTAPLDKFSFIKRHALLHKASKLVEVDCDFKSKITHNDFKEITDAIPTEWLEWEDNRFSAEEIRAVYMRYLCERLDNSSIFVTEAVNVRRESLI